MAGFFLQLPRYTVDQPTAGGAIHLIDTATQSRVTIPAGEAAADFYDDWEALTGDSVDIADCDAAVGVIFNELAALDAEAVLA